MESVRGHALLLPFPAQGHITPFMQLAKFLISEHVLVTFVNTDYNHQRLNPTSNDYITLESFPDGLPPDHGRTLKLMDLVERDGKEMRARLEWLREKAVSCVESGGASYDKMEKFLHQMTRKTESSKTEMDPLNGRNSP